ncbi:MAG: EamA family transporter [Syntrophobacterales bacterium]|jgi:multidrug transporter EmrE-like cation transporter|nr:EamA family transporter [Syntrophobacterales bacterium]
MVKYAVLILILLDVILNVTGQLSLKYGMARIGNFSISLATLPPVFLKAATNFYVLLGLVCYGMGFMVWLIVLSKAEVSYAYPLISLGYVFTAILARAMFGEAVSVTRMVGIMVTCLGVFLIARS